MGIKEELASIKLEFELIEESKQRISFYKKELNKHNPFSVGDTLIGNDKYSNEGKEFIVSRLGLSYFSSSVMLVRDDLPPRFFIAEGCNLKRDGSSGKLEVRRSVKILEDKT